MSDVKQAAERLRRAKTDGESSVYFYADPQFFADRSTIIDAYLAEHAADDDEPITEDWLDRQEKSGLFNGRTIEYRTTNGFDLGSVDGIDIPAWLRLTTRGQLRLLLRALNPERGQP